MQQDLEETNDIVQSTIPETVIDEPKDVKLIKTEKSRYTNM